MTTAIYLRISQDSGFTRAGVRRQLADCQKLCATRKWAPTVVYEDNDVSAYSGKKRPAYQRMLDAVRTGEVDRIVAWNVDRLHRHPREIEDFIDLVEDAGCEVHSVTAGVYDLSTVDGRLMARVVGNFSRAESERKAERVRRKHIELAEAGALSGGGSRPFGYRHETGATGNTRLVIDKTEAAHIRRMMAAYLAGQSARAIAADLREQDIPTVNGGLWRTNTVQGILTSAVISGQREHRGKIVAAGDWKPIVTPENTAQARSIARMRSHAPKHRAAHPLTGLCVCAACGRTMHKATHSRGESVVRCPPPPSGCGRLSIRRDPLELLVVEALFQAVDQAPLPDPRPDRELARDVDDAEQQLGELAALYADRVISAGEWRIARDRIQRRIDSVQGAAVRFELHDAAIRPFINKPGRLRRQWDRLTLDQQRAIVAAMIEHVTIAPAVKGRNRFDPDRVDITWRD